MIDVSNIVLREVKNKVHTVYSDCYITTTNPDEVTQGRVIALQEKNNTTYERSLDFENKEHHANVYYQVDVYSNSADGKMQDAKCLMKLVDEAMLGLSFKRTMCQPTPNVDRSYYRMTARYEAVVSEGMLDNKGNVWHNFYRR